MSLFADYGGSRVTSARVHLDAWGAPSAVVQLADDEPILPTATLTIGDFVAVMSVERTGPYGGSRGAWLIAGANGWGKLVRRQFYRDTANGVRLSSVLRDVAALVGETVLVLPGDDRILGQFWARQEDVAAMTLARTVGKGWWINPLGVTQLGARPSSVIEVDFDPVDPIRPELGTVTIATEDLLPWVPGATFSKPGILDDVLTISSVSITMAVGGKLRLEVLTNP